MKYVKSIDITILLPLVLVIRVAILGASIGDSLAIIGLSALFAYRTFLQNQSDDWKQSVEDQLEAMKNEIVSVRLSSGIMRKSNESKKQQDDGKRWF